MKSKKKFKAFNEGGNLSSSYGWNDERQRVLGQAMPADVYANGQVYSNQSLFQMPAIHGAAKGSVNSFSSFDNSPNYNLVGKFAGNQQQSFPLVQNAPYPSPSYEANNKGLLVPDYGYTPTLLPGKKFGVKLKKGIKAKHQTYATNDSSSVPSPINKEDIIRQLRALIGTQCLSSEEKYQLLKKRDELMYRCRIKNTDVSVMQVVQGTCPDMCPEKERYRREYQKNLSPYECDHQGRMLPAVTVKEYSRSAADQEEPLPHELRPPHVLRMTMDYLVDAIARHIPPKAADLARWYDFLWSRTRSIRKEISQQMLSDNKIAVDLMEKCIRLHAFASFWMANLDVSDFDPKLNRENLSKCLQTLRHMYEDLGYQRMFSPNEAEFRCYDMLLNLYDSNVHSYVSSYREDVRKSPQVQLALILAASLQSNNYVKFIRLIQKNADFLQTCLCHQYITRIRFSAMETICSAYKFFEINKFMEILAFEKEKDATDFLAAFGIRLEGEGSSSLDLANGKFIFGTANVPRPESLPIGYCSWVLHKIKRPSLAEVLCNVSHFQPERLPRPIDSFDENGRYTRDPFNNSAGYSQVERKIKNNFITID